MYSIIKMRKKKKLGLGLRNDWQLKLRWILCERKLLATVYRNRPKPEGTVEFYHRNEFFSIDRLADEAYMYFVLGSLPAHILMPPRPRPWQALGGGRSGDSRCRCIVYMLPPTASYWDRGIRSRGVIETTESEFWKRFSRIIRRIRSRIRNGFSPWIRAL
jgi:hypothetical protein